MMKRGKFFRISLRAFPAMMGLMTMAAAAPAVQAKELTIAVPIALAHRDPMDLLYLEEWEIYAGIHDSLVQYDVNQGFTGILAERWNFDSKNRTLTFKIRPEARFSDGSPLTAEDAAFSLKRVLYLDRDRSQTLTRCLAGPTVRLKSPEDAHTAIRATDAQTLVLGPLQCGEALLNDLANANYGVVSKRALDSNFKVTEKGPFSGLFTYSISNGSMSLYPNLNNWRWRGRGSAAAPEALRIVHFDRERFMSVSSSGDLPDVLRISQPDVYQRAQGAGYQFKLSLPIMTWFLAPAPKSKLKASEVQRTLEEINAGLDRAGIPGLKENVLERPTTEFFPSAFNCGPGAKAPSKTQRKPAKRASTRIEIIDHPSGEGSRLAADLVSELRKLGYTVADPLPAGSEKSEAPAKTLRLMLRRQFLGDSLTNLFNMLFRVLKTIPDPANQLTPALSRLEQMGKGEQAASLASFCRKFHHFEHIPIAHRSYAFAARDERNLEIFSKVTGNLLLEQFPKIGGSP